jgi:hypothetical protein
MKEQSVKVSTRLRPSMLAEVEAFAGAQGLTNYAAMARLIESGLRAERQACEALAEQLLEGFVSLAERVERLEKFSDRALFAAIAAYSYTRATVLTGKDSDSIMEIDSLARESGLEAYEVTKEKIERGEV